MTDQSAFTRTITELDHIRIYNMLQRQGLMQRVPALADLIDSARHVPPQKIAADVVTMLTRVRIADAAGNNVRTVTLCYPADADAARGDISVLSPLGTALLGLRAGESAAWNGPDGKAATITVQAIEFQPEANGDYTD
jgi:regulator of nucleoside diphosphate kinase